MNNQVNHSKNRARIEKEIKDLERLWKNQELFQLIQLKGLQYAIFLLHGAVSSPYEGHGFRVRIQWPSQYPWKPPQIKFIDKIWNPFVDSQGNICINILMKQWSPALTTWKALLSIMGLLSQTKLEQQQQFLNPLAASQMKNNYYYYFDYAKSEAQKHSFVKKNIYKGEIKFKQEQIQVLENRDGFIEQAIEKDLTLKNIREKGFKSKYAKLQE